MHKYCLKEIIGNVRYEIWQNEKAHNITMETKTNQIGYIHTFLNETGLGEWKIVLG